MKYVPGFANVCVPGLKPLYSGLPSPKFHCHAEKDVVKVSVVLVIFAEKGAHPEKELKVKSGLGDGITLM